MNNRDGLLVRSAAALLAFAAPGQVQASTALGSADAPRSYAGIFSPNPECNRGTESRRRGARPATEPEAGAVLRLRVPTITITTSGGDMAADMMGRPAT